MAFFLTVTKPSRITSDSAKIINNIFTNSMTEDTISILFISDITDHLPIFTVTGCKFKETKEHKVMTYKRIKTEESINVFNKSLSLQDWKPNNSTKCPWPTKGILNACKKKNNLYKNVIKSKTTELTN